MTLSKIYEFNGEVCKLNILTSIAGGVFKVVWQGKGSVTFNTPYTLLGQSATCTVAAGQTLVMRVLDSWPSDPIRNVTAFTTADITPSEFANIGGEPFTLAKNWDFGTTGTVTNTADLAQEFQFHDMWGTVANGTNYGAIMTRPVEAPNFGVSSYATLNLNTFNASLTPPMPTDAQPVDNNRYRSFTSNSLVCKVLPLNSASTSIGVASTHNSGNGSMVAKYTLPTGGKLLGKDICWETRVRMTGAPLGYWFALWATGTNWNSGPEMDVVEAFSSSGTNINGDLWHSSSVNGNDIVDFSGAWDTPLSARWGTGFATPNGTQTLRNWHTFTWIYKADDTYKVYVDGKLIQYGTLPWIVPFTNNVTTDMWFLFDFSFGHVSISPNNAATISNINSTPLTYEIDYSRIWLRDAGANVP